MKANLTPRVFSRRWLLARAGTAVATSFFVPQILRAALRPADANGYVVGEPGVEDIGARIATIARRLHRNVSAGKGLSVDETRYVALVTLKEARGRGVPARAD